MKMQNPTLPKFEILILINWENVLKMKNLLVGKFDSRKIQNRHIEIQISLEKRKIDASKLEIRLRF